MAYVNATRTTGFSLTERLSAMVEALRLAAARREVFARTLRELSDLSDRELADLGLHRSAIRSVALEAAYGA